MTLKSGEAALGNFDGDYGMFDDGVELSDVTKNYREFILSLEAFKE